MTLWRFWILPETIPKFLSFKLSSLISSIFPNTNSHQLLFVDNLNQKVERKKYGELAQIYIDLISQWHVHAFKYKTCEIPLKVAVVSATPLVRTLPWL